MSHLTGKRILLAASRKIKEVQTLFEKQGAEVISCPLQHTSILDEESLFIAQRKIYEADVHGYIWTTGMGLDAVNRAMENYGWGLAWRTQLRTMTLAIRGYKTKAVMRQLGLTPHIESADGTIEGLIEAFADVPLQGKRIAVQLHGEPAPQLKAYVLGRGAQWMECMPYEHREPDSKHCQMAVEHIVHGTVDAVCFTSPPQVRFLFQYATANGMQETLTLALSHRVLTTAIGQVTAQALHAQHITRIVVPEHERIGAMVVRLGQWYAAAQETTP